MAEAAGHIVLEARMEQVVTCPVAGGTAALISRPSPTREDPNEDGALVLPVDDGRGLLAVADGVGGHVGGGRASRTAVETLARAVGERDAGAELRAAILDAFEAANASLLELGVGAATTLLVVELDDGRLRPYHAGDSDALLVGQRGRVRHQTVSHSPVGYAVEAGLIDQTEAMCHEDRHLVSNAIGTEHMHIEMGPVLVPAPRDTLLLATDGLWDNATRDEVIALVRKGPLADGVGALAELAGRRMAGADPGLPGKPDDLTIVAWRRERPARRPRD